MYWATDNRCSYVTSLTREKTYSDTTTLYDLINRIKNNHCYNLLIPKLPDIVYLEEIIGPP